MGVDTEGSVAAIRRLQQRVRALGLADFLDVNIPVGKLSAQVQLIKRLLNQAHVADALAVNLDPAAMGRQLRLLRAAVQDTTATIPVNFDISQLPDLGPLMSMTQGIQAKWVIEPLKPLADAAAAGVKEKIPVTFDIGKMPRLGPTESIGLSVTGGAQALLAEAAAARTMADAVARGREAIAELAASGQGAVIASERLNVRLAVMAVNADRAAAAVAAGRAAIAGLASSGQGATRAMQNMAAATAIMDGSAMRFAAATVAMQGGGGKSGGGLLGLAAAMGAAGAAFGTGTAGIGRWGGALTATIPILGIAIRSVAAWHVVLDLAIEALIAVGLAAVTITPALLIMANVGKDIATHFQAVHTVTESLGQSIGPLTGGFDKLAHAMAPQVITAFGGAMNAIAGKTGLFGQAVTRVIPLINDWIASIDLWMNAQNGLGKFITAGIGYLSQFASIIGNVVSALGQLLTKDPGIAHYLLDIVNGAALLLKAFSSLPAPIVVAVLALHGIYLWGSVLAPLLLRLAGYVIGLAADFLLLAANPFTWVAIAVAGLALLAYQSTQASSGAKAFVAAIDQRIALDNATTAILDIAAAVGQLTAQIQSTSGLVNAMKQWSLQSETLSGGFQRLSYNMQATGSAFGKAFGDLPQSLSTWGALSRTVRDFGHAIADVFSSSSGAAGFAANNIKLYDDEINKLIRQQGTLFRVAGLLVTGNNSLTKSGYSLAEAFALEDLAGVKASDSFDKAAQKVKNLITGYQQMSVQGGILLNSVNAITFASLQQQSNISALNSAWTTFISTVTGGLSAFSTFQQQVSTIGSDLSGVAPAAIKGATSLGGLSAASLQANLAFTQGISDANSLINALTLQASAAGLGAKGTDMLTAATKDAVAQLIPMAGNSKAAQAGLIALAKQGGFPAGESFRQLEKWVGTASGSMGAAGKSGGPAYQLNAIMGMLATSADNLTTDVKNLSIALGQQLSDAEAQAILLARGGTKPFDDFSNAVRNGDITSQAARDSAIALGDEFLALSHNNVPAAQDQFEAFAKYGLNLTQGQADALWKDVIQHGIPALDQSAAKAAAAKDSFIKFAHDGLHVTTANAQTLWAMFSQQNIDVMSRKAGGAKAQFIQLAMDGLHLTTAKAQELWNMFVRQKLDEAASKAGETKRQFETLAGELGLAKAAADRLWGSLHKVASGSPYRVGLIETGAGTFTITQQSSNGMPIVKPQNRAVGGRITGGIPGRDSVLGMLMPGEVVVPTDMVNKGAVDHLRGKLPGFAAGGLVRSSGTGPEMGSLDTQTADFHGRFTTAMTAAMKAAMDAALKAAETAAIAAAMGSGGDIVRYAESFLGRIPYVFGGNSLTSGIDCSGFVQQVYGHFGINAPRTSEGQGAWVKRSPPVPGGLAFYHSPPGGPDPGHVAIVADGNSVISQGGGLGPRMETLRFLPLLWTGVPPGGFGPLGSLGSAGNLSGNPSIAAEERYAASLFPSHGWSQGLMPALIALWQQESGWSPWAVNPSSGAYGIPQALPAAWDHPYPLGVAAPQINWGEDYIASVYGNPAAAWGHEVTHNWYRKGGAVGLAAGGMPASGRPPDPRDPIARALAAGGLIPAMAAGGKLSFPAFESRLKSYQLHEAADYAGLQAAFAHGPARYAAPAALARLALAKRQQDEVKAYGTIAGQKTSVTGGMLAALANTTWSELSASRNKALSHLPGGHPGWVHGLGAWLTALNKMTQPGMVPYNAPWKPGGFGPAHSVPGGVLTFDRGGRWPSGTFGWNGSGKTETVTPGGGGGAVTCLHLTVNGPVGSQAELESWFVRTANHAARTGKLTQAVRRAAGN